MQNHVFRPYLQFMIKLLAWKEYWNYRLPSFRTSLQKSCLVFLSLIILGTHLNYLWAVLFNTKVLSADRCIELLLNESLHYTFSLSQTLWTMGYGIHINKGTYWKEGSLIVNIHLFIHNLCHITIIVIALLLKLLVESINNQCLNSVWICLLNIFQ